MLDDQKINFMFYCDLAIEKLNEIKRDYIEGSDKTDPYYMRQVIKKIRDTKYLYNELLSIAIKKKEELNKLIKGSLDE